MITPHSASLRTSAWLGVGFGVFWIVLAVVAAMFNHGAVAIAWAALGGFCVGGVRSG